MSVVDMAVQLYREDRKKPELERKYKELAEMVNKVKTNSAQMLTLGKVKTGPQTDAILKADVVCATPIGAADRTFWQSHKAQRSLTPPSRCLR